ncbi:hypothetical protein [Pendulispora albinea]|uniref:Uncharacterized protein n=1 Tax=Pendulispora albinea TaxID=2741071 RepID=A0ABZ2M1P8_9BACT
MAQSEPANSPPPAAPAADNPAPSEPAAPAPAPAAAPAPAPEPAAPKSAAPSYFQFTEAEYLHGFFYREPFNPDHEIQKEVFTFQHYGEWALGRNFFFFDFLKSHGADGHANEVYGEAYASLTASKVFGTSLEAAIFQDINLTMGVNVGAKTNSSGPLIYLPGITTDWKLPGFAFFHVDTLLYIDQGRLGGSQYAQGCTQTTFQITPAWDLPFALGPARFSFQGFVDIIGAHGQCEVQVLAQPQLRFDIGNFFNAPDKLYVGTEFQYWLHKYGFKDVNEAHPQTLVVWRF